MGNGRPRPGAPQAVSEEVRDRGEARARDDGAEPPARHAAASRIARCVAESLGRCVPAGTPIVAAVSGGADSVALAWGLSQAIAWPLRAVVFVDHGLGRDLGAERAAAQASAERAEVPFIERRVEVGPGNLQAAARKARYAALIAVARGFDERAMVATGHTLTDQAETVLARLLRGSGVPGLAGLGERRGRLVRPLLGVGRTETRACGWPFADDPSNATARFQRNRVRRLLAGLAAEGGGRDLEAALADVAAAARGTTRLLDALAVATGDVDLSGLDPETVQALLIHRARSAGARAIDRKALRAWADALIAGGVGATSLGHGLRGLALRGRAEVVFDDDPRATVAAWRAGTYRASAMLLELTEMAVGPTGAPAEGEAWWPASAVSWPVKLRRARPDEVGAFGDEIDLSEGSGLGGWRVEDASGRTLVPAASGAATTADVGSSGPGVWMRIVLKPFEHQRDRRVVGSS